MIDQNLGLLIALFGGMVALTLPVILGRLRDRTSKATLPIETQSYRRRRR